MKKQWIATMATIAFGASTVVGCGGSTNASTSNGTGDNNKPVTIQFYEAMSGGLGNELKKLTDEFHQQNPNITVQLVFNGSYTTQKQKLTAALSAHKAPTIAQVQETWETEYYKDNLLVPMDGVLSTDTVSDLIPIWKQDNSYDGKLMSAPFNKSAYVLMYNTDDFAKAGITSPPTTWDELEQDAMKLTKSGVPGLGIQANWYTFEMLLNQAGGKVLNSDETQAAFGDDAGKQALTFMNKLVSEKAATVIGANAYLSDGFNTNKYAMDLDTTASMSFVNKAHYKVAPLPAAATKAVPTAGTNIVMFKSASADEQKAAAKYLNFLLSKDATIEWAEATGYLPVRQSALTDSKWQDFIKQHPEKGVAPAELSDAYFSPRLAALFSGENNATTQIGNCMSGSQNVADTLQKCVDAINQALKG